MTDCNALLDLIRACHLQGGSHILSAVSASVPQLLKRQHDVRMEALELPDHALAVADHDDNGSAIDSDSEHLLPQVRSDYNGIICCIAATCKYTTSQAELLSTCHISLMRQMLPRYEQTCHD